MSDWPVSLRVTVVFGLIALAAVASDVLAQRRHGGAYRESETTGCAGGCAIIIAVAALLVLVLSWGSL